MTAYTDLVAKLKAADDDWESIGPQPESRIDEIEAKFNIQLPVSFRRFLTEVGGIHYPNHYFTSIDDDYLDDRDGFMFQTNVLREQAGTLPDGFIALESDHDANEIACLDLNQMQDGECPVVWIHAFDGRIIGDCADSFDGFFRKFVEDWAG